MKLSRSSSAERQPNKGDEETLLLGAEIFLSIWGAVINRIGFGGARWSLPKGRLRPSVGDDSGLYSMEGWRVRALGVEAVQVELFGVRYWGC